MFEWLPTHQQACENLKKVIRTEVLLSYPDFNRTSIKFTTDASDPELGAVIMQR